jgi:hypothetical protein
MNSARFDYSSADGSSASLMPRLSLLLHRLSQSTEVTGLLDTGSAVNVLPYSIGLLLGANWDELSIPVSLVGTLGQFEARALVVQATHPQIITDAPVQLVFAWTQSPHAPVIFGQMNFFLEFDVCFFRSNAFFEITRRTL